MNPIFLKNVSICTFIYGLRTTKTFILIGDINNVNISVMIIKININQMIKKIKYILFDIF